MQFVRREAHGKVNMPEKIFVPFAQIIQAYFAVRRGDEAIHWTFAVTRLELEDASAWIIVEK